MSIKNVHLKKTGRKKINNKIIHRYPLNSLKMKPYF